MDSDHHHEARVILSVRVPRPIRRRVKALAASRDITVEALVGELLDQELERSMPSLSQQVG